MTVEFVKIHPFGKEEFVLPADKILGTPRFEGKTEDGVIQKLSDFLFAAAAEGRVEKDVIVHVYTSGHDGVDLRFPPREEQPMLAAQ